MDTSTLNWIPVICSLISVAGAVAAVFIVSRGTDAELKGDVNDLSALVERISKDQRKERMRRVRAGEKDTESFPVPPGAENIPLSGLSTESPVIDKAELRRRARGLRSV